MVIVNIAYRGILQQYMTYMRRLQQYTFSEISLWILTHMSYMGRIR